MLPRCVHDKMNLRSFDPENITIQLGTTPSRHKWRERAVTSSVLQFTSYNVATFACYPELPSRGKNGEDIRWRLIGESLLTTSGDHILFG